MRNLIKNGQKSRMDISRRKTYTWPRDTWKNTQQYRSSGKYNSKVQWDNKAHLSQWRKSMKDETAGVAKDVWKELPSCTVGKNANWCSQSGKHYGHFSKKKKKTGNGSTLRSSNFTTRYFHKEYKIFKGIHAPWCLHQHFLQQPNYRNYPSIHQLMNKLRCSLWNVILLGRKNMKSCHLPWAGWSEKMLSWVK